jgi:CHAT domain-containing protein/tetratricopeptide (TPR) repeat protein
LGFAARRAGDLVSARTAWQVLLAHRVATLPDQHPDLQAVRANLAVVVRELGDLRGARALQEQVLAVLAATLSEEHPDLQRARGNLAITIKALGDLQGARTLQEQVLAVFSRTLPAEHPDLQRARFGLALTIKALGDLQGARALEAQGLAVLERTLPGDHVEVQRARLNLANTMQALGDLDGARRLQQQVLSVLTESLPDDHPDLQAAREGLANTRFRSRDLLGARELQQQVLAARTRALPDDHPDLQRARCNLAGTLAALGDLQGARVLQEQVLLVWGSTLPEEHPDLLAARQNFANTLAGLGDLHGAQALEEQVLAVKARTLPADHPALLTARMNLAVTSQALGDLRRARELGEQVLAARSRTLPDGHPDLQAVRGNLASTIRELGDLYGARALEEQVLAACTRTLPDDHPDLQRARMNLAVTSKELGDLHGARALLEQVLAVRARLLPDDHPDLRATRGNLAGTLSALGDLRGARELFEQVMRSCPARHPDRLRTGVNLAITIAELGDPGSARALLEQELTTMVEALPEDHPDLLIARQDLAATKFRLGDLDGARALDEQVLACRTRTLPDDHPALQAARDNLALTLLALGDVRTAAGLHRAAAAAALRRLSAHVASLREAADLARAAGGHISHLGNVLDLANRLPPGLADDLRRDMLQLVETARSLELHSAHLRQVVQSRHPEAFSRLAAGIQLVSQRLDHAIGLPPAGSITVAGQSIARDDAIRDATLARDALERELLELVPADLQRAAAPAEFAERLAPHEVAISFLTYTRRTNDVDRPWVVASDERLAALVLTHDGTVGWYSLAPLAEVESLIEAMRRAAVMGPEPAARSATTAGDTLPGRDPGAGGTAAATLTQSLQELRRRLFDAILPGLPADTTTLVLSLADELHLVPLDELPLPSGKRLGDAFELSNVWSLRALLESRADHRGDPTALVLGGPDFDRRPVADAPVVAGSPAPVPDHADSEAGAAEPLPGVQAAGAFAALPGARGEAERIGAVFAATFADRQVTTLLDRSAGVAAFAQHAVGKTYVHLATHGYFAPEQTWTAAANAGGSPLRGFDPAPQSRGAVLSPYSLAGLALAGANLPADALGRRQGILTAQEVVQLELWDCELATLSACRTALGIRRAGAGLASLRQAFHAAGARFVLATLWDVQDAAAQALMIEFYDRLWRQRHSPGQALRGAKAAARARGAAFRDWAAFVLSGR